jgi:hypothetical protein
MQVIGNAIWKTGGKLRVVALPRKCDGTFGTIGPQRWEWKARTHAHPCENLSTERNQMDD